VEIEDYLKIQEEEFLEFLRNLDIEILIAAKDINCLIDFYSDYNAKIVEFVDSNSYVICRNDGNYELFIKGSFSAYRERFKKFLIKYCGISKGYELPSYLNVDHVLNKGRAKNHYIKMILLDERVNQDWGRAYEKGISKRYEGKFIRDYIRLDYVTLLKCLSFPAFKKYEIKDVEDIPKIAEQRLLELLNYADLGKNSELILGYFRAEINYLVNGTWRDTESNYSEIDTYSELDKYEVLTNALVNLSQHKVFKYSRPIFAEGSYKYLSGSDKEKCSDILSVIGEATDLNWVLFANKKTLKLMKINLYFKGNVEEKSYFINMKKSLD
jgi:hypothetical protein